MPLPVPSSTRSPRPAPLPEHCEAVLQLLGAPSLSWDEITSLLLRDPVLTYLVFDAAPLERQRLGATLRVEMAKRLETLGVDLARAWLLQVLWETAPPSAAARDLAAQALLVAECALHLALETRHPHPDEAYLAGLWHRLGEECLAAGATDDFDEKALGSEEEVLEVFAGESGSHTAELAARLAERCGVSGPLADALALQRGLDEQLLAAHPLVRLLWAARKLAAEAWQPEVDRVAQACGLTREAVLSLRTDVGFLAATPTRPAVGTLPREFRAGGQGGAFDAMRDIALSGLARAAFAPGEPDRWAARLAMACRLLCGEPAPLVVAPDEGEVLRTLPLTAGSDAPQWFEELAVRMDDEASAISLAARSATIASSYSRSGVPARSPVDWHVARWLGGEGIVCLPLNLQGPRGGVTAVAVLAAHERRPPPPATLSVLRALCTAAAQSALDAAGVQAAQGALRTSIENRLKEHARRVVHEASNPLSIIKNHLEIMARRQGGTGDSGEIGILQAELDRLGELLRQAGELPPERPEPPSCDVPRLLEELRVLYGDTLFARRGIRFDLRPSKIHTPAAIPASALKQVLVNLFRNAAEALQPGGRFSVSVPGAVSWNGVPCLEIRLIDNGPGLPPERVANLFAPGSSGKGGAHQGLGLAIVREILEGWHASVLCRSQPSVGTSFQLFIPLENEG